MCFNELIIERQRRGERRERDGKICDEGKYLTYDQTFLLSAIE